MGAFAAVHLLDRYLLREILAPFAASLTFLTVLLLATRVLGRADILLGSGASLADVGVVVACLTPSILAYVVPIAFLLGAVLGVGRLATDRELIALGASGISPARLLRVTVALSILVAAGALWLAFDLEPAGLGEARLRLNELVKRNITKEVRGGTFYDRIPDHTLYVERAAGGRWENVLVWERSAPGVPVLTVARRGHLEPVGTHDDVRFVLDGGEVHRHDGTSREHLLASFERGEVVIALGTALGDRGGSLGAAREQTFAEYEDRIAEARGRGDAVDARRWEGHLHRKIASALVLIPFAILAVPLGAWRGAGPAFGVSATFLLVVIQYLLLRGGEVLAQRGAVPAAVGLELGNLLLAGAGVALTAMVARRGAGAIR